MSDFQSEIVPRSPPLERTIAWAAAAVVLLPNLLIFSTDDLSTYNHSDHAFAVNINQAGDGRYIFCLLTAICHKLNIDYNSFLLISFVVFSVSMPELVLAICDGLHLMDRRARLGGVLVVLTFGLSLDLYQFTFAYLSYGVSVLAAAAGVRVATASHSLPARFALCTLLAFIGFGSYQAIGQMIVMAAAALVVVPRLNGSSRDDSVRLTRAAMVLLGAAAAGALLYLATNQTLKALGVFGFAHYPAREQGLRFVVANLSKYAATLGELLGRGSPTYQPLLPIVWRLALFVVLGRTVGRIVRLRAPGWQLAIGGVALAIVAWPNPANLLLGAYWPSARSLSGFGLFFGLLCAAWFAAAERPPREKSRWAVAHVVLGLVLVGQCLVGVLRLQDRMLQQEADVTLAQSIILKAYELSPTGAPIDVKLGIDARQIGTDKPVVLDYGRSLFATPWSAPDLLEHLSGHRVSAAIAEPHACDASPSRLSYVMRPDGLLVCLGGP